MRSYWPHLEVRALRRRSPSWRFSGFSSAVRLCTAPGIISLWRLPLADRRDWHDTRDKWPLAADTTTLAWSFLGRNLWFYERKKMDNTHIFNSRVDSPLRARTCELTCNYFKFLITLLLLFSLIWLLLSLSMLIVTKSMDLWKIIFSSLHSCDSHFHFFLDLQLIPLALNICCIWNYQGVAFWPSMGCNGYSDKSI